MIKVQYARKLIEVISVVQSASREKQTNIHTYIIELVLYIDLLSLQVEI